MNNDLNITNSDKNINSNYQNNNLSSFLIGELGGQLILESLTR